MPIQHYRKNIKINRKVIRTNNYCTINRDAMQLAMCIFKPTGFQFWCFLAKNAEGFKIDIGPSYVKEWFIKKDTVYKTMKFMLDIGYLIPLKNEDFYGFEEFPNAKLLREYIDSEEGKKGYTAEELAYLNAWINKVLRISF